MLTLNCYRGVILHPSDYIFMKIIYFALIFFIVVPGILLNFVALSNDIVVDCLNLAIYEKIKFGVWKHPTIAVNRVKYTSVVSRFLGYNRLSSGNKMLELSKQVRMYVYYYHLWYFCVFMMLLLFYCQHGRSPPLVTQRPLPSLSDHWVRKSCCGVKVKSIFS